MIGLIGRQLLLCILLFSISSNRLAAQQKDAKAVQTTESSDEKNLSLDSVVVSALGSSYDLRNINGGYQWNMGIMHELPKFLGNADPIRHTQMLPGIQTNNEYSGGLHIEGCDNQHNIYSINDVPLYNVSHILGFFSTFNASHFAYMSLQKSPQSALVDNRLGARLDMQVSQQISDTVSVDAEVGLISSQGTLRLPLGKKTNLLLSARASYINLFYSAWLKSDEQSVEYSFYDLNASIIHQVDRKNHLLFDFYTGGDRGDVFIDDYLSTVKEDWGNSAGSVQWRHDGGNSFSMKHIVYFTHYYNKLSLELSGLDFRLPSNITDYGYKGNVSWKNLSAGANVVLHNVKPQHAIISGGYHTESSPPSNVHGGEYSLYADYKRKINDRAEVNAGLRYSAFVSNGYYNHSLSPNLAFVYFGNTWKTSVSYAMRRQYMLQIGFSSIGLPTESWTMAGNDGISPQLGHGFSWSATFNLGSGKYQLELDAYYKWLDGQAEYEGNFYDFIVSDYSLNQHLLHGSGRNFGASLMLVKRTGRLTGWASYSFGRALRTFTNAGYNDTYPANHERIHEFNLLATYKISRRLHLGATFVLASGTPFTAPEYFYMINQKIVTQYSKRNSNRLPAYCRMDLSLNCRLGKLNSRVEKGLNLSLYNALSRRNLLYYGVKLWNNEFAYKQVNFLNFALPSISFYCRF